MQLCIRTLLKSYKSVSLQLMYATKISIGFIRIFYESLSYIRLEVGYLNLNEDIRFIFCLFIFVFIIMLYGI